jgi:hypothetical protein
MLVLEGTETEGFRFLHADRTEYGRAPSAGLSEIRARASRALRLKGFHETEAQRAIARVSTERGANVEQVIREALRDLAIGAARTLGTLGAGMTWKGQTAPPKVSRLTGLPTP